MKRCERCGVSDWRLLRECLKGHPLLGDATQARMADFLNVSLATYKRLERSKEHRCPLPAVSAILQAWLSDEGIRRFIQERARTLGASPLEDYDETHFRAPYGWVSSEEFRPGQAVVWTRTTRAGGRDLDQRLRATVLKTNRFGVEIETRSPGGEKLVRWAQPGRLYPDSGEQGDL